MKTLLGIFLLAIPFGLIFTDMVRKMGWEALVIIGIAIVLTVMIGVGVGILTGNI